MRKASDWTWGSTAGGTSVRPRFESTPQWERPPRRQQAIESTRSFTTSGAILIGW